MPTSLERKMLGDRQGYSRSEDPLDNRLVGGIQ
jgi:hypothetical protein